MVISVGGYGNGSLIGILWAFAAPAAEPILFVCTGCWVILEAPAADDDEVPSVSIRIEGRCVWDGEFPRLGDAEDAVDVVVVFGRYPIP